MALEFADFSGSMVTVLFDLTPALALFGKTALEIANLPNSIATGNESFLEQHAAE